MCHQWQQHFGKPSRNGYHNKQWADKMESVGLIALFHRANPEVPELVSTWATIQLRKASLKFRRIVWLITLSNCPGLIGLFRLHLQARTVIWTCNHDRQSVEHKASQKLEMRIVELIPQLDVICEDNSKHVSHIQKRKTTYQCPNCSARVWGKPKLAIACLDCEAVYQVV